MSRDTPRGYVGIRVEDTGIGFDLELIPIILEPFTQGKPSLGRGDGGLGLGLSVVKLLAGLYGGTAAPHSEGEGKGACFTVTLPLSMNTAEPCVSGTPHLRADKRTNVLIIEDNVDLRDSLRSILESGGHRVYVAHDGPNGIAEAKKYRPNLVLGYIGLPGIDGYGVVESLRAEEGLKDTLLVSLTGYARYEDRERALAAGFNRHLSKPASMEILEEVIAEVRAL